MLRQLFSEQARARGFVVRKELRGVRQDYEDIVREIEGDLGHLEWKAGVIAVPVFTKNAFVWQSEKTPSIENSGVPPCVPELSEPRGEPSDEPSREDSRPARDDQTAMKELHQPEDLECGPDVRESESSEPAEGADERCPPSIETHCRADSPEGGGPVSVGEERLVWDSTATDAEYSILQKGCPRRSLAQDVPRRQEDLCLHRNNLSMELLWLQQAINSRKKYLLLKQRLGLPER
ncbi:hypothetical protein GJAV_G00001290 [Gymnothorax javanicus]|nr:hypothetical protein GJAV_G00001290 [Gymnothorax javanicus]